MVRSLFVAAIAAVVSPLPLLAEAPPLPTDVTSFGATVLDDAIYVYGGHTGPAHTYSTEDQSNTFLRLDLSSDGTAGDGTWKELAAGPKLQGLALVAHDDHVYRLGGFTAVNEEGEDHDLRSQAGVAIYDPASDTWNDLTPLPEPRSSFNAAVLDDRVYVLGGWNMQGEGRGEWHTTGWSADLTKRPLQWDALPPSPFQRRALSVAARDGKVYAIGGMTPDGTTRRVDVYDVAAQSWSIGPELIGERGIHGFGTAAWATPEGVFVSSLSGVVQRLDDDGTAWSTVASMNAPRFFHAMVPAGDDLLIIGGANMSDGKITEPERVALP